MTLSLDTLLAVAGEQCVRWTDEQICERLYLAVGDFLEANEGFPIPDRDHPGQDIRAVDLVFRVIAWALTVAEAHQSIAYTGPRETDRLCSPEDWQALLYHGEAEPILASLPFGWLDGGCWMLAEALKRALGDDAHLMIVGSQRADGEHVVCLYRGWYYDGNGIHRRDNLLKQLTDDLDVPDPYLRPLTRAFIATTDIPAPDSVTDQMEAIFHRAFAPLC